jgi:hypothetical protein
MSDDADVDANAARVASATALLSTWAAPSPHLGTTTATGATTAGATAAYLPSAGAGRGAPRGGGGGGMEGVAMALEFESVAAGGADAQPTRSAAPQPPLSSMAPPQQRLFARPEARPFGGGGGGGEHAHTPAAALPWGAQAFVADASAGRGGARLAAAPLARHLPAPAAELVTAALGGEAAFASASASASASPFMPSLSATLALPPPRAQHHPGGGILAPLEAVSAQALLEDPHRPAEAAFAAVVEAVCVHGALSAADAPAAFEASARAAARAARDAGAAVGRAAAGGGGAAGGAAARGADADALESEADTWALMHHLLGAGAHADEAAAAADEEAAAAAPLRGTLRARVRRAARGSADPAMRRVARVVAWLEASAARSLDARADGASLRFAPSFGQWRETARELATATSSGGGDHGVSLVRELDPDAPARSRKALHPANEEDEARLCGALLALLRAGRLRAGRELCARVGQPWRAAALGGGAPGFAPAPVGAAAEDDAAEERSQGAAAAEDARAAEVAGGGGVAARALWKWACAQAAASAASSSASAASASASAASSASSAAVSEAALFGALAGDVARVLPACAGEWEASAWALLRCWLDTRVDDDLSSAAAAMTTTVAPLAPPTPVVGGDGVGGVPGGAPAWPSAAARGALPADAADAFARLAAPSSGDASVAAAAATPPRQQQRDLALARWPELCRSLVAWAEPPGGGAAASSASASHDALAPAAHPGRLRAAAHLLLWLRALAPPDAGFAHGGAHTADLEAVLRRCVHGRCCPFIRARGAPESPTKTQNALICAHFALI